MKTFCWTAKQMFGSCIERLGSRSGDHKTRNLISIMMTCADLMTSPPRHHLDGVAELVCESPGEDDQQLRSSLLAVAARLLSRDPSCASRMGEQKGDDMVEWCVARLGDTPTARQYLEVSCLRFTY